MISVDGWTIYAHPLLLDQLGKLTGAVEEARKKDPDGYARTADTKVLAQVRKLIFEDIPQDPTRTEYRQGGALGKGRKHWFRAKFAKGRFRLFFRYDTKSKVLIFAWMNDSGTLRTYGSKTDAYVVFKKMLGKGAPPDDWDALLTEASAKPARERLAKTTPKHAPARRRSGTSETQR